MRTAALIMLACLLAPSLADAQYYNNDGIPKISVSGEAVVRVTPDKVTVHLGVETHNRVMGEARDENNGIVVAALGAIRGMGIEEKHIQTDHLSIHPRSEFDRNKEETYIVYYVRNSLSVVLMEPDRIDELIATVLEAGVTNVHGVNFETTEFKKHREEARRLALEAAREKAEKMAAVLGKDIGDPITINEDSHGRWSFYSGYGWGWGRNEPMSQNVVQNAGGDPQGMSDTIALGKITVRGGVRVSFELK